MQHFFIKVNGLRVKEICPQGKAGAIITCSIQRKRETITDYFSSKC